MGQKDPRIDVYIRKAAPFAQPILKHLREIIHVGCPSVEETIKWQFPHFDYKGVICGVAAFQSHCAFGFWKAELILGDNRKGEEAMGQFGRIESLVDLPDDKTLIAYVRKAAALNEAGVKKPRAEPRAKPPLVLPRDFATALRQSAKAQRHFKSFTPSKKREYVEWITEAKREATRQKRVETAVAWISQGKIRNWKHV